MLVYQGNIQVKEGEGVITADIGIKEAGQYF